MTIIVYKCDVCKRSVELPRNVEGMERIQRCTITLGCRGRLYQEKLLQDYIRGDIPPEVSGLDNWLPRKVLHNHTQSVERDNWIITHDMGVYPIVSVFIDRPIEGNLDNREEVTPQDIVVVDKNTVILKFAQPWSGIAQLVGRQSDPNLLHPLQSVTVTETFAPVQLSLNGEITIATRIGTVGESASIDLNVQYKTGSELGPLKLYVADDQPTINSAWIDYNKIIVKGKVYTVRSFNGVVPEMTSGVIKSGSTFNFTSVYKNWGSPIFQNIEKDEILILLSSSPFQTVDKLRDRFIDVTSVTDIINPFSFYYDSGEFFAEQKVIQTTYPLIRSV